MPGITVVVPYRSVYPRRNQTKAKTKSQVGKPLQLCEGIRPEPANPAVAPLFLYTHSLHKTSPFVKNTLAQSTIQYHVNTSIITHHGISHDSSLQLYLALWTQNAFHCRSWHTPYSMWHEDGGAKEAKQDIRVSHQRSRRTEPPKPSRKM